MRLIDVDSKSNAIYVSQFVIDQIQKIPPIDPIRAAGGCRCGECKFTEPTTHTGHLLCTGYVNQNYVVHNGGCLEGELKEPKDDG